MTTISIAYEVPTTTVDQIRAMLDETARTHPDWNGAEFNIVRAESTFIDSDSYDAAELLNRIHGIIQHES
jgi:hypothetical protein